MKTEKQNIDLSEWNDALSLLDENSFFEIMHLYLGEIKTPYNRQKLISELSGFLKNQNHIQRIKTFLTPRDFKILSAVKYIKNPTKDILADFFTEEIPVVQLYNSLSNLEQRLIIFTKKNDFAKEKSFHINPIFENEFSEYLTAQILFSNHTVKKNLTPSGFAITPLTLSAFVSAISAYEISCKSNGELKKNAMNLLLEIFPEADKEQIQLLENAFLNLALITETGGNFSINEDRLKSFSNLDEDIQNVLLCSSAVSLYSRNGLRKEAQLLFDCLQTLDDKIFSEKDILRLSCIIQSLRENPFSINQNSTGKKSRFETMMENAFHDRQNNPYNEATLMERLFSAAVKLGIIQKVGTDEKEILLYRRNTQMNFGKTENSNEISKTNDFPKTVSIDSIYSVTIMPGLSLSQMLEMSTFLMIKKMDVAAEFELSKKSAAKYFDRGKSPENLFSELEKFSTFKVSENLIFTVRDWFESYNSARVYKGYILKLSEQNIKIAEGNANIKKYIKEKISEGIYLLNVSTEQEFSYFKKTCGLDLSGTVRSPEVKQKENVFPAIQKTKKIIFPQKSAETEEIFESQKNAEAIQNELLNKLDSLDFTQDAKNSLKESILKHLIICEEQITLCAVKLEKLEASGMDFSGKLRILETAEKNQNFVEITIPKNFMREDFKSGGETNYHSLIAKILMISKQEGEAIAKIQIEPEKETKNILVSKITNVKLLK